MCIPKVDVGEVKMVILPSSHPVKSKQDQITEKAETGLHFFCSSTNFWSNWVLILYFKSFTEILDQNTLCSIVAACYKSNHLLIFNLICFCIIIQTWICSEYNVNHKTRQAKKKQKKNINTRKWKLCAHHVCHAFSKSWVSPGFRSLHAVWLVKSRDFRVEDYWRRSFNN